MAPGLQNATYLVDVTARRAESFVMQADRIGIRSVQQAIDLARLIVEQLDLSHAELVGLSGLGV